MSIKTYGVSVGEELLVLSMQKCNHVDPFAAASSSSEEDGQG